MHTQASWPPGREAGQVERARQALGYRVPGFLGVTTDRLQNACSHPNLIESCGRYTRRVRFAFFGLPLAALLLEQDGHHLDPVVLSPVPAVGHRRARRRFGEHLIDAAELSPGAVERAVDERLGRPSAILSWFWTRRLPERWLSASPRGYGVHPSLLPRHRGPDPCFWALDLGDSETGVTLHRLDAAYDTGAIVAQERLSIPMLDRGVGAPTRARALTAWRLARALDRPSLRLLREAARQLARGDALPERPQNEDEATWAPIPSGELLKCPWASPTARVLRRIHALSPEPGVPLVIHEQHFELLEACEDGSLPTALFPGEAHLSDQVRIRTGDGGIRALVARLPDGHEISGEELAALLAS
ncbi:MAG: hypothetical protein KIT72_16540 [Polyangiaceae bacterium]|nr:hypothetical protein [Polyangiaceae bacterium]MCW5792026.1 hypothetical protein [Polyangiaceae bacterium]